MLFLGDGERDLNAVQAQFPDLPIYAVRGNCNLRSALSTSLTCVVGGVKLFAAHGHLHQVKYEPSLETLTTAAREAEASMARFGHTSTLLRGSGGDHPVQSRLHRPERAFRGS